MVAPVRFTPAVEQSEPNEVETRGQLIETLLGISKTTLQDEKEALRAVHAKSHGLLRATLTVRGGLPPELAQGLFARPARYDAVMRLSAAPGDLLPDSVSTHHGFAIKVKGVSGERLEGPETSTQDFLFANGKAFSTHELKQFLKSLKLLAQTTDKAEGLKVALSRALRVVETGLESVGLQSTTATALGGRPTTHILSEEFFSQTPFRYGDFIAKFGLFPVTEEQNSLADELLNLDSVYDAQRQAVRSYMAGKGAKWELRAQLCTDLTTMPVERPDVPWPEDASPYVTVAELEAPPQEAYADAMILEVDRAASFSPWHGLAAHQPLGAINRARLEIYKASARFRLSHNGCPLH